MRIAMAMVLVSTLAVQGATNPEVIGEWWGITNLHWDGDDLVFDYMGKKDNNSPGKNERIQLNKYKEYSHYGGSVKFRGFFHHGGQIKEDVIHYVHQKGLDIKCDRIQVIYSAKPSKASRWDESFRLNFE